MTNLKIILKNNQSNDATLKLFDENSKTWTDTLVPKSSLTSLIDQIIDLEQEKKSNRFYILLDAGSKDLAILEIPLTIEERVISNFSESTFIETVVISNQLSELSNFANFDKTLTISSQNEVINVLSNG